MVIIPPITPTWNNKGFDHHNIINLYLHIYAIQDAAITSTYWCSIHGIYKWDDDSLFKFLFSLSLVSDGISVGGQSYRSFSLFHTPPPRYKTFFESHEEKEKLLSTIHKNVSKVLKEEVQSELFQSSTYELRGLSTHEQCKPSILVQCTTSTHVNMGRLHQAYMKFNFKLIKSFQT